MKLTLSALAAWLVLAGCGSSKAEEVADQMEQESPSAIARVCQLRATIGEGGTEAALVGKWRGTSNALLARGYGVSLDDLADELVSRCD